jgi:hypothetical protein
MELAMKTYLKIKIKSLAAEAQIIKIEERRWKTVGKRNVGDVPHPLFFNLRSHRLHAVRKECRSSNLAYGFLRGRDYKRIENKCYESPDWKTVEAIVKRFADKLDQRDLMQRFSEWKAVA